MDPLTLLFDGMAHVIAVGGHDSTGGMCLCKGARRAPLSVHDFAVCCPSTCRMLPQYMQYTVLQYVPCTKQGTKLTTAIGNQHFGKTSQPNYPRTSIKASTDINQGNRILSVVHCDFRGLTGGDMLQEKPSAAMSSCKLPAVETPQSPY
jgi:hypothetical protein